MLLICESCEHRRKQCHMVPINPSKCDYYVASTISAEQDPTGRDPGEPGAKLDANKPRISLVINGFPRALWAIAEVATFGASKYSDGGWQSVPNGQERYFDAELRHMLKKAMGEEIDTDSNLLHLAQEAWNSLAKLELYLRANQ